MAHEILIAPVTVVRRRQLSVRRRRPIIVRHYTQREEKEGAFPTSVLPPSLSPPLSILCLLGIRSAIAFWLTCPY